MEYEHGGGETHGGTEEGGREEVEALDWGEQRRGTLTGDPGERGGERGGGLENTWVELASRLVATRERVVLFGSGCVFVLLLLTERVLVYLSTEGGREGRRNTALWGMIEVFFLGIILMCILVRALLMHFAYALVAYTVLMVIATLRLGIGVGIELYHGNAEESVWYVLLGVEGVLSALTIFLTVRNWRPMRALWASTSRVTRETMTRWEVWTSVLLLQTGAAWLVFSSSIALSHFASTPYTHPVYLTAIILFVLEAIRLALLVGIRYWFHRGLGYTYVCATTFTPAYIVYLFVIYWSNQLSSIIPSNDEQITALLTTIGIVSFATSVLSITFTLFVLHDKEIWQQIPKVLKLEKKLRSGILPSSPALLEGTTTFVDRGATIFVPTPIGSVTRNPINP